MKLSQRLQRCLELLNASDVANKGSDYGDGLNKILWLIQEILQLFIEFSKKGSIVLFLRVHIFIIFILLHNIMM
jgi:hypothetical protein